MQTIWRNFGNAIYDSPSGATFTRYDARSDDDPMTCADCGAEVWDGWLCLDGGAELCDGCVSVIPAFIGRMLADDFRENIAAYNALVEMRCAIGAAVIDCFRATHVPGKFLGWTQAS